MSVTPLKKPADRGGPNIVQTAAMMVVLTMISKLLGFVRELILADVYGTSFVTDAYAQAQNIGNVLTGGIIGALGAAYTPLFSEISEQQSEEAGKRFTNQLITLAFLAAAALAVLGVIFSEQLVSFLAPGFSQSDAGAEKVRLTVFYLRVVFGFVLVSGILSIYEALLRYKGHFRQPILAGYLNDFGMILFIVISARKGAPLLAFGLLAGGLLQLSANALAASRVGYLYHPDFRFKESSYRVFMLALPIFANSSLSSINGAIDQMLASRLPDGIVAALGYGHRVQIMIYYMTAAILGAIFYPKITKAASLGDWGGYSEAARKTATVNLILMLPLSLGAVAFANQVVQVIYERGAFDTSSTVVTADAFRFYSMSLVFLAFSEFLSSMFQSLQDMKTMTVCGAIGVVSNIALNLALIGPLQHKGLALASSISAAIHFAALRLAFRKKHPGIFAFPSAGKILRIAAASLLAVLAAILVYQLVTLIWMPRAVYLAIAVLSAVAVYLPLLVLLRIEEVEVLKDLIKRQ